MGPLRSRVELWAQCAGLFATGWLIWTASVAPYWNRGDHLIRRILEASSLAVGAFVWSAAIGLTLTLVMRRLDREPAASWGVRLLALAWFAPAIVLFLPFSFVGVTAGLALIVTATRLYCQAQPADPVWYHRSSLISTGALPIDLLSLHFVPVLMASVAIELAGALVMMGRPLPAAFLLAVGLSMLTSVAIGLGAWEREREPSLPRSVFGLCLTVLLALALAGRGGGWGFGFGSGLGDSDTGETAYQRSVSSAGKQKEAPFVSPADVPGGFGGVILWPEVKPVTTLIAPALAHGGIFSAAPRRVAIPFGGEYWMFRSPYQRPPKDSYFQRGTPAKLFFSTTDRRPLQMEAHHKLDQPMSMRCCGGIELQILNADRYPGTVFLELILIDRDEPGVAPQSLGIKPVNSIPDLREDLPAPVPETLDFQLPAEPHLAQFDELKVVFHRANSRLNKSARVALERFVLVP